MSDDNIIIQYGDRTNNFREFIRSLLKRGKLKQEYIDRITDEEGMKMYSEIFTDETADPVKNYEFWEILGDKIANSCILKYFSRKYPMLRRKEGVTILSRLVINYGSKETFAEVGMGLDFVKYISADEERHKNKRKQLVEDCFEAFFGYTSEAIDERVYQGAGYPICYNIIKNILDDLGEISLNYYDLVDPKTRLKETYDKFENQLNEHKPNKKSYVWFKPEDQNVGTSTLKIKNKTTGQVRVLGTGQGSLKIIGEQNAAENALETLKNQGYEKPADPRYILFGLDIEKFPKEPNE